jgi:7-cyano-7-deazaguanine synthase in queuosine biosynthesis
MAKVTLLTSGGLDSTTALAQAYALRHSVVPVYVDYGQPNRENELVALGRLAATYPTLRELHIRRVQLNVPDVLNDQSFFVAARNAVLGSIGLNVAAAVDADELWFGFVAPESVAVPVHKFGDVVYGQCEESDDISCFVVLGVDGSRVRVADGSGGTYEFADEELHVSKKGAEAYRDAAGHPDTTTRFVTTFQKIADMSLKKKLRVVAPLIQKDKSEVMRLAERLRVPLHQTWSCYSQASDPCGKCGACAALSKAVASQKG